MLQNYRRDNFFFVAQMPVKHALKTAQFLVEPGRALACLFVVGLEQHTVRGLGETIEQAIHGVMIAIQHVKGPLKPGIQDAQLREIMVVFDLVMAVQLFDQHRPETAQPRVILVGGNRAVQTLRRVRLQQSQQLSEHQMALKPELNQTGKIRVRLPGRAGIVGKQNAQRLGQLFAGSQCKRVVIHTPDLAHPSRRAQFGNCALARTLSQSIQHVMEKSPIQPTDDEARALAKSLMSDANFAALGVLADDGSPHVTRIGVGWTPAGVTGLISSLAYHHGALMRSPDCSLLLGEPPDKGDPLAFARLTLQARAEIIDKRADIRDAYLATHPKSKLYVDFADFNFVRFVPRSGALNGGFGKAYVLSADDLI